MSRPVPPSGFTLLELMVTIAIVAILLAVGLPSFEGIMRSNRVATSTNDLMASISLARSEATRNPNGAAICTSLDGTACGGTWNDGWMVWIDVDGDATPDAGERVVRYTQGNNRLALTSTPSAGSGTLIQFDGRGRIADNRTVTFNLQPATCDSGLQLQRQLVVQRTGQVRITREYCA